jgi:predicted transcriptional regulator
MAKPPSPKPIRLTITVSPEVHAAFTRMSEASSLPIGRCMGEWLADTLEGVQFITDKLERVREAPKQVVRELRQLALGAADLADEALAEINEKARATATEGPRIAGSTGAGGRAPRLVIRGGKSTTSKPKGRK